MARRQPIPPRRRRHNPRRAVALRHDPLLLRQRPAPPGTCRNNLEPRDLRNRRMVSHTPMSSPSACITQGGARRSDTSDDVLAALGRLQIRHRQGDVLQALPVTSDNKTIPGGTLGVGAEFMPSLLQKGRPVSVFVQYSTPGSRTRISTNRWHRRCSITRSNARTTRSGSIVCRP